MIGYQKLINVGEKTLELNYGPYHYELAPGEMTPPLGSEALNSFCQRNPDLRVYNEAEGMLETPENTETFPGHTDAVDDPDRVEGEENSQPEPAVAAKGRKKK